MDSRTPPHLRQSSFFTEGSPSTRVESSEPSTPLSSRRHKGPHRDGFSVKKCRDVLVRHCSWIPRNYNFKDGVNQVYEVLREYLGDENLDLAIAQLNELIEVPSQWLHDEGASFQAWKHDYMRRHKDFENSHVPRLRNIIVAPVIPTERLKKWREEQRERATLSSSQVLQKPFDIDEDQAKTLNYGIGARARGGDWRLENALFVSSKAHGTRILQCPSAQELHSNTWNEDFGRGGKLVQERTVNPGQIVDDIGGSLSTTTAPERKKSFKDRRSMRLFTDMPVIRHLQSITTVPEILKSSLRRTESPSSRSWHSKQGSARKTTSARIRCKYLDPLSGRFAGEVKRYEGSPTVRDLPDPGSDTGKSYYCNIPIWPLPNGTCVPSPRFARKHGLVPEEVSLPGSVAIKLLPTADEMAIEKSFQDGSGSRSPRNETGLVGPFTPELFKDSGIDFPRYWGDTTLEPDRREYDLGDFSDMGALGDAAQSPRKPLQFISVSSQTSSSVSTVPLPQWRDLDIPAEYVLNSQRGRIMAQPKDVASNSKDSDRRRYKLLKLRYYNRPRPNVPQLPVVLHQAYLILRHPRADFAKDIQHILPVSFCHSSTANLISSLVQKVKDPLKIPDLTLRYHRRSFAVTQTKSCDNTNHVDPHRFSSKRANTTYTSNGSKREANKQLISLLEMNASTITIEHASEGNKDHRTQADRLNKGPLGNKGQSSKNKLRVAGNHPAVEALVDFRNSIIIGDSIDHETIAELVQEIHKNASCVFLETILNWGSSTVEPFPRVVVNNNENRRALKAHHSNNIKTFTTNSLSTSPATAQKREWSTERMPDLLNNSEVDLNRDLPPLPLTTDLHALQIGDQLNRRILQPESDVHIEFLQPSYYDPVRDSLKYGGVHYHPDGMRYYPEVLQHPPRTSSMLPPQSPPDTTAFKTRQIQVESGENLKHSIGVGPPMVPRTLTSKSHINYNRDPDSSSEIMGNFIPVKSTVSPSVFSNGDVNNPRVETKGHWYPANQNSKCGDTCATATSRIPGNIHGGSDRIDGLVTGNYRRGKVNQGLSKTFNTGNDHYSIDLDDPDALAKYIRYLKNIRKRAEVKKQTHGLDPPLSQNVDGEADKFVGNDNGADCYMFVEPDENANIMVQDYSEIRAGNPFNIEPDAVQRDFHRLTTITDFMGQASKVCETPSPRDIQKRGHLKNSQSESNALYTKKRPEPIHLDENVNSGIALHRSDSSPGTSPNRITVSHGAAQASLQSFYTEENHPEPIMTNHNHRFNDPQKSPTRAPRRPKSPLKNFNDIPESQEMTMDTHSSIPKRPWSPVKKIFGEGGWVGNTPNSKEEVITPKKLGLVEKIKLKIEEIGLKADLSPIKYSFRSEQEKSWEQSTFPISLNPAQQAELYLDIELLICDSANTFLMHEYQNGRMSVDSLKRVIDFWKSKGRPQVVEFHYDQSTQRDLIVANQKTFRFYGPNANNPLQVHAMLYAWKTNAREMAVRTFCYPDSMIRKHIQDIFVMLDFLGGHPFQYIAAHEVQGKLVRWVQEAQEHISARSSRTPSVKKVGRCSNESLTELVVDNPWYNADRPIQSPSKEKRR